MRKAARFRVTPLMRWLKLARITQRRGRVCRYSLRTQALHTTTQRIPALRRICLSDNRLRGILPLWKTPLEGCLFPFSGGLATPRQKAMTFVDRLLKDRYFEERIERLRV